MTRRGIEPQSPGPLANTLLIRPMARYWHNIGSLAKWLECSPTGFSPWLSHIKSSKMVIDASFLNIQHYKVRIKDKWSNPKKGVVPTAISRDSSYRKKPLGYPRLRSANLITYVLSTLYTHTHTHTHTDVCVNIKIGKKDIQGMSLLIVEYSVNIKRFSFII